MAAVCLNLCVEYFVVFGPDAQPGHAAGGVPGYPGRRGPGRIDRRGRDGVFYAAPAQIQDDVERLPGRGPPGDGPDRRL